MKDTTLSAVINFLLAYLQFLPYAMTVGIAVVPMAILTALIQIVSRHK